MSDRNQQGVPGYGESAPVYQDLSPNIVWGMRITGAITIIMVLLSFIFTLAQGNMDHSFYLLTCNLIISSFVGGVNTWWYRKGDLPVGKYWYLLIVCGVILFQCITTDIFVFAKPASSGGDDDQTTMSAVSTTPTQ